MDIHRSLIKDFIMPKVKSIIVIDYYEGIKGLLKSRDEFPYDDFFANPRLRTQSEIIWSTESFTERPQLLIDLDGVLKDRYAYALKERINAIESLIEILKEEGAHPLSELLSKAVSYVDERSVYCGDGNIIVVNWGLIPRSLDYGPGSIYRSGKFVANWDRNYKNPDVEKPISSNAFDVTGSALQMDINEQVTGAPSPVQDKDVNPLTSVQEPAQELLNKTTSVASENSSAEKLVVPSDSKINEIGNTTTEKSQEKTEETVIEQNREADDHPKDTGKEKNTVQPKKKDNDYTWGLFFKGFWLGLKFLVRKLWWIILLLLLILGILYFCKGCHGPISQINPFYNPLPDKSVVLPIEDGNVGMSADGKTQIATDRLNILLEKKNDDTMLEWARAFKKAYPGDDYLIFYYNEEYYNLQIKVPSEEREQIKQEIKEKLHDFSFDVFDETVYQSDFVSFNDPELSNQTNSWYIDAIEVQDAWSVTLGDSDVVVAVVDNGFDLSHPELQGKVVHPFNVLTQDTKLWPIVTNNGENAHGTHVAATAVGNGNNGTGLLGIAPNCRLLPVQVANDNPTGSMSNQAVLEGVSYAISQGADVVNVSLGMYTPAQVFGMSEGEQLNYISNTYKYEELMWNKVFDKAKQNNCIIVFAAGNDNVLAGIDPKKRSNETIRVSALNTDLKKADFSNYGVYPQLNRFYSTVSAPGVSIYSAAPHGHYVSMNGTSMAAPVVSGSVALLKSIDRSLTIGQVTGILQQSGLNVGDNIGPMINLKRALMLVRGEKLPTHCDEIAEQIRKLQACIDSLKEICPDAATPSDTLKYKEAIKNKHGLDGLWKSTTSLVSTLDYTPIELFMQFKKLKGTLTIVNNGEKYEAPLEATIKKGEISIIQLSPAKCGEKSFVPYTYECTSDRKGNFICTATSKESGAVVTFNLVRVK